MLQMAQFACWMDGKCAAAVKAIALATHQCKAAMSVEYFASATDGKGRLYVRHCCAQTLPRDLRLLLYGATHKEVDMSGAHYELTRAICASNHRSGSFGSGYSSSGLPDWALRMQKTCSGLLNSSLSGSSTVVLCKHWVILIHWGLLLLLGWLPLPMSLKQLEMRLRPTFSLLFDLAWRLNSATDISMRLKHWKGSSCNCFC